MKNRVPTQGAITAGDRKIGMALAYTYLFFYYVRPQEYVPGLAMLRIAGIIFLATTIWGALHFRPYILRTPVALVLLLGTVFGISGIGAVNVGAYRLAMDYVTQLFPQCLAIYVLFDSRERILKLMDLWVWIYFLMALITIKNGGSGPGDFTSDPNNAALALAMGIPLVFYSIWYRPLTKRQEYFRWAVIVFLLAAIVATQSRGGFVGLLAVAGLLWWFCKNRLKVAAWSATIAIVGGGFAISLLPPDYVAQVQSISDPDDNTRVERLRMWEVAWIMYKDNPIFGVGPGNYQYNASKYQRQASWWTGKETSLQGRVTHSIYFQILSEVGTVGALIYIYILLVLTSKLYRLRNRSTQDTEDDRLLRLLCQTLIASMGAFAISGAFLAAAYYPHIPIWLTMYAIVMRFESSLSGSQESAGLRQTDQRLHSVRIGIDQHPTIERNDDTAKGARISEHSWR